MNHEQARGLASAYVISTIVRAIFTTYLVPIRAIPRWVLVFVAYTKNYLVLAWMYANAQTYVVRQIRARGEKSLIAGAILIPVSVLVAAVLIPAAFSSIYGANTSGWNSAVVTVFQVLLPVLTVIAIAYSYVKEIV